MPVRDLIRKTRTTTLAIKPCFMMSPLAVSPVPALRTCASTSSSSTRPRRSPPATPSTASTAANALITAGDDRQLPPTSFFDRMTDDEDETGDRRQRLPVDPRAGQGLRSVPQPRPALALPLPPRGPDRLLQPEVLRRQAGHLPRRRTAKAPTSASSCSTSPGVYRRGTSRDNPIEAEQVAERVVHHFDTRPDTSLGRRHVLRGPGRRHPGRPATGPWTTGPTSPRTSTATGSTGSSSRASSPSRATNAT